MEFRLLGALEARHEGRPVDLGDLQQRYVLVVLLLHRNRPVSQERVTEIVWGTNRPSTNLTAGYIAKIRKTFREVGAEDVAVETTPTGYVLRVASEQVDIDWFRQLCAEATAARRAGNVGRTTELLREAVALWRGTFLEDLDVDRVGGSEVAPPDEAYLDALCDLAELELAAGNHRWVRDQLRLRAQADPDRPRLAALLMRALLANGDRVQAMEVYHRTREALNALGMPMAGLRRLAQLAQYGDPPSTLPPRPRRFTGRVDELAAIVNAVQTPGVDEPHVVWLSGMPGVGKTALAVAAAHHLGNTFDDGRLFVTLNGFAPGAHPVEPTDALAQLLLNLGVPAERLPSTLADRAACYQATLAGRRILVVLDNAANTAQVQALIPQVTGCAAIVTSRMAGDNVDAAIRLGPLPNREAAVLFRELVGPARLRGHNTQVDEVVDRCGRVPLVIQTVAAQFRRHERWPLDHLLAMLADTGPEHPSKQEANAAAWTSYQRLPATHQRLFRLLGHNPTPDIGYPAAAALANCDPTQARVLLDDLFAASLLEETAPERYAIADPLKEFAVARSAEFLDEAAEAMDRLLDFYLCTTATALASAYPVKATRPEFPRTSSAALSFPNQPAALAWLATERTNLVCMIRSGTAHARPDHVLQLAALLSGYRGTTEQHHDWSEAPEVARPVVLGRPDSYPGRYRPDGPGSGTSEPTEPNRHDELVVDVTRHLLITTRADFDCLSDQIHPADGHPLLMAHILVADAGSTSQDEADARLANALWELPALAGDNSLHFIALRIAQCRGTLRNADAQRTPGDGQGVTNHPNLCAWSEFDR